MNEWMITLFKHNKIFSIAGGVVQQQYLTASRGMMFW